MLQIIPMVLGPVATNTYLLADADTSQAVVIDPAWDGHMIAAEAQRRGWRIDQIWITHAHFDHFAGLGAILAGCNPPPSVALHAADLPLWRMRGGADLFGIRIETTVPPDVNLQLEHKLQVGHYDFTVRHTPGHSPGHVIFYCASEGLVFCGDTIFASSVGRTDLPGGDEGILIESIRRQILTLSDDIRLLCGHGEETSVGIERKTNLYLR